MTGTETTGQGLPAPLQSGIGFSAEDEAREEEMVTVDEDAMRAEAARRDPSTADAKYERLSSLLEKANVYSQFLRQKIKMPTNTEVSTSTPEAPGPETDEGEGFQPPKLVTGGRPRKYQLEGVEWLVSLYENGLNGILADEMGLGKTFQTISFLAYLREQGVWGPFLIVGPLSTLGNWFAEYQKFAPTIPTIIYHGTQEERATLRRKQMRKYSPDFPVVITSYEMVIRDRKYLQRIHWKYIVVDEGHRLKNLNCRLIRELKSYNTANRLLLTGTPLQNNLSELWSLLNFLLPEVFDDLDSFLGWFDVGAVQGDREESQKLIAEQRERSVVSKLHECLRPFVLRRLKADVELSIPIKREVILFARMTPEQEELYRAIQNESIHEFLESKKRAGVYVDTQSGSLTLMNKLMQLRKTCNHPFMFYDPTYGKHDAQNVEPLVRYSGKLQVLDRLLRRLHKGGHRVLIYSQMTRMLDILEDYMLGRSYKYCRLDGSTHIQDRIEQMRDFNAEDSDAFAFLLSTRAGGLGINLATADTVIFYDSDWNPQQDLQAMDRAHRIGQKKPVMVYRLCSHKSVEVKILDRATSKLRLERLVIHKGKFKNHKKFLETGPSQLSSSELKEIVAYNPGSRYGIQTGEISDEDLERILDRSDMERKSSGLTGEGFQVLTDSGSGQSSSLLAGLSGGASAERTAAAAHVANTKQHRKQTATASDRRGAPKGKRRAVAEVAAEAVQPRRTRTRRGAA